MIVRPDAINARSAPSTNPLNSCDTKFGQLTTNGLPHGALPSTRSGVAAEIAAESIGLLHERSARNDLDDLPVVLLVLHLLRRLASNDDDGTYELVVLGTEVDITDGRGECFAFLVLPDDVGRIEA